MTIISIILGVAISINAFAYTDYGNSGNSNAIVIPGASNNVLVPDTQTTYTTCSSAGNTTVCSSM